MNLTVNDVARAAEVSPRTIRQHIATGRLRATKAGRDWLISEEDAKAWLATYAPYDTLRAPRGDG